MADNSFTSSSNKQWFLKLALFFIVLFAMDRLIGFGLEKLYQLQRTGSNFQTLYGMERAEEDILIFGTSIGASNYRPDVFEKELGKSCYNISRHGMNVFYDYALQQAILERYEPDIFILDMEPNNLLQTPDQYDKLSCLLPFYRKHPEIHEIVKMKSKFEEVKLLSSLYTYNSEPFKVVNNIRKENKTLNGHKFQEQALTPERREYLADHLSYLNRFYAKLDVDTVRMRYFDKFLKNAEEAGVEVYVVVPPILVVNENTKSHKEILNICAENKVPVFDYTNIESIKKPEWFFDLTHMNSVGAEQLSLDIVSKIERIQNNKRSKTSPTK